MPLQKNLERGIPEGQPQVVGGQRTLQTVSINGLCTAQCSLQAGKACQTLQQCLQSASAGPFDPDSMHTHLSVGRISSTYSLPMVSVLRGTLAVTVSSTSRPPCSPCWRCALSLKRARAQPARGARTQKECGKGRGCETSMQALSTCALLSPTSILPLSDTSNDFGIRQRVAQGLSVTLRFIRSSRLLATLSMN